MHGIGKPHARVQCAFDCAGPVALRLLQLRSVHETLAAERHQAGLCITPTAERLGPFGGAAQVEEIHALEDQGAVGDSRRDRIEFTSRHRHHDLVEPGHARVRLGDRDERLPLAQLSEHLQIGVVEPVADFDRAITQFNGVPRVARFQAARP